MPGPQDPGLGYFTNPASVPQVDSSYTKDDADNGTIKQAYADLKQQMDDLDAWHAFDIKEDELTIKMQIKAHQLAFELLSPALAVLADALAITDEKFRQGN